MIRFIQFVFFTSILLNSVCFRAQESKHSLLHIQVYDQGICTPMVKSPFYSTSKYQKSKSVFQSGGYYSTIHAYVNTHDSSNLHPESNHKLQSSSLLLRTNLNYELVLLRQIGFNTGQQDSMIIKIENLKEDAQLVIPFKKGTFSISKMKGFKELRPDADPNFRLSEILDIKKTLKLDSTAYYENGKKKAKYFQVAPNYPLFYVQEFDRNDPGTYSCGYRLITNYGLSNLSIQQSIWNAQSYADYGYWEYYENSKRIKHEMRAGILQHQYEWYPSGQIKYESEFGNYNKSVSHIRYLENGSIKEEFQAPSQTEQSYLKVYSYDANGTVIIINSYHCTNGITTLGLKNRKTFYPSGRRKMEENFVGNYTIKYYNEDGTERSK